MSYKSEWETLGKTQGLCQKTRGVRILASEVREGDWTSAVQAQCYQEVTEDVSPYRFI